ncbi:MAG: hypothetical protein CL912_26355 [Deltaproteobacteria bacterium]|nr:hypothetical protein [Deltaproteobacteria bacterium]
MEPDTSPQFQSIIEHPLILPPPVARDLWQYNNVNTKEFEKTDTRLPISKYVKRRKPLSSTEPVFNDSCRR